MSAFYLVCQACPTAWWCKSTIQPDGGEGLANRKGAAVRRVSEGSGEQEREPMNKNRIKGIRRVASWQVTAKPILIKSAGCKFGGCARKAVGLTLGDLLVVADAQLGVTRVRPTDQQKSAAGVVLREQEGPNGFREK